MGNPGGGLGSASAVFMGLGLSSGGSSRLRRGEWQGLDERLPLPWALEFKSQLHRFLPGGHGLVTSASRRFPSVKQGDDIDRRFAVGVRAAQRRLCSVKVNQAETSEVRRRAAGTPSHATLLTDTAPPPQMPEEEAFCVFVRLMQEYRLRELFKPSMAELGLCIYQFEYMLQVSTPRWSCLPTPPPHTLPAHTHRC